MIVFPGTSKLHTSMLQLFSFHSGSCQEKNKILFSQNDTISMFFRHLLAPLVLSKSVTFLTQCSVVEHQENRS